MTFRIAPYIRGIETELVALRHELHQIPEPGLQLPQTAARVRAEFEKLGMEITDASRVSGFAAVLRGGGDSPGGRRPVVLLRADMDALPVREETGLAWASTNGAMHACGHDMHMAGIVGAARALSAAREDLAGDVVFFLQPGEEADDGAQHLIDDGLLEAAGRMPDHAYGLHVWSAQFPPGRITSRPGQIMASSDEITLTVHGSGGHGSTPHRTHDPIVAIAEMITQSQVMVARRFNILDPVVVTCGAVHAGSTFNAIPGEATALFTLRAFSPEARSNLKEALLPLFGHIAAAHDMTCDVEITELYPPTVNDADEFEFVAGALGEAFPDRWALMADPVTPAEDFSKILNEIPGDYVFVSAVAPGQDAEDLPFNHSPQARYDDSVLGDCSIVLAELAARRLGGAGGRGLAGAGGQGLAEADRQGASS